MKLHFYGGAETVTGSNYLFETGDLKVLVDCGLFQGTRFSEEHNYEPFPFHPAEIDYLLVTHSHTDHAGRIPKLYKDGFRGQIIATEPTAAIMPVALEDTLERIKDEAHDMGHVPLYRKDHLHEAMQLVRGVPYRTPVRLNEWVTITFHESSHILGSANIEVIVKEPKKIQRLIFSGDVGNPPTPLLNPLEYPHDADYVVIESAYGNRKHEDRDQRRNKLENIIVETAKNKGVLIIPSFALERIQELLLEIEELVQQHKIPHCPVFVDSPLAIRLTEVYGRFPHYFNQHARKLLEKANGFQFPWLKFTKTVDESKQINEVPTPKIIIAGSGMSQGGRVLHHESRYLSGPHNTLLFVGYQVKGSLGRRILEGAPEVKIFGKTVPVRCKVSAIGGYSAHADQDGLIEFIRQAHQGRGVKKVFIVQGELDEAQGLAQQIGEQLHIPTQIPSTGTVVAI
jgi:metallo-beta-lactamase family protein